MRMASAAPGLGGGGPLQAGSSPLIHPHPPGRALPVPPRRCPRGRDPSLGPAGRRGDPHAPPVGRPRQEGPGAQAEPPGLGFWGGFCTATFKILVTPSFSRSL